MHVSSSLEQPVLVLTRSRIRHSPAAREIQDVEKFPHQAALSLYAPVITAPPKAHQPLALLSDSCPSCQNTLVLAGAGSTDDRCYHRMLAPCDKPLLINYAKLAKHTASAGAEPRHHFHPQPWVLPCSRRSFGSRGHQLRCSAPVSLA